MGWSSWLTPWKSSTPPPEPPQQAPETTPTPSFSQPQPPHHEQPPPAPGTLPNNLKLLLGGIAFASISLIITGRAMRRRQISSILPFYTSQPYHRPPIPSALEALEALNIATINVFSYAMVGCGAVLWKLDVNSVEDLRTHFRRYTGIKGSAGGPGEVGREEAEEEFERDVAFWASKLLGGKFGDLGAGDGDGDGGQVKEGGGSEGKTGR